MKHPDANTALPSADDLADLVRAVALSGDRQAFAVLFKHFAPRVKSYLVRAGADDGLAEEVTQEAMVALWRKAALFDGGQAGVATWVFTIARNLRVDRFRRQGGTAGAVADGTDFDTLPADAPPPEERLHAARMQASVRNAIARLPAEQAQVLRLSFYEDQPHAQIAHHLGIPLGTVKSRSRLAVARLRRLLDESE
ncbi:sigma-70 family RNA polymerase sigma factor [uncultured Ramlibacter sp.]|uniref:sigma-70 family RNA polymerase sigma factor n=1 Tax=uncultured Ramlibacter sp. TaxID=260755 RepID=UPI002622B762|nr:sigma-70 family RNA polymerase sigma factor [uncultured Ramlibacter sp.]